MKRICIIVIIFALYLAGCTKHLGVPESNDSSSDQTETSILENEGDIEIIVPEDQESGGF